MNSKAVGTYRDGLELKILLVRVQQKFMHLWKNVVFGGLRGEQRYKYDAFRTIRHILKYL